MAYIRPGEATEPIETKKLTRKEKAEVLKIAAAMYMSKRDFWPSFEVQINLRLRADLICVSRNYRIVIVEVKSSKADFESDKKWERYLPYCDEFYFCADDDTCKHIREAIENEHPEVGYLELRSFSGVYPDSLYKTKRSKMQNEGLDPLKILWLISRTNCLFLRGMYKGLHKVNPTLISPDWNMDKNYKGSLGGLED